MGPNEPRNSSETLRNPPILDVENLASATECTGLVPSAIQDEGDAERYARLYAIHRQKPTGANERD